MGNDDKIMPPRRGRVTVAVLRSALGLLVGMLLQSARAHAEETQARLLSEPFEYTEVADALDGDDPFDLNVRLGFERSSSFETITRESVGSGPAPPGHELVPVAQSEITQSSLVLGFDAGIYQDLMLFVRMPLVLSETRKLSLPSNGRCGSPPCGNVGELLRDVPVDSALTGHRLLELDPSFESTTRSGVPHFDFGVAWGIVNQYRQGGLPSWVISAEGRVPLGDVMKPCAPGKPCSTGISRGTARLKLETRFSYRVRYLEPYFGLSHAIEWATSARDRFMPGGELAGFVDAQPPSVSEMTLGAVIVPWEERGHFQRFGIELRGSAGYVSSGRDYTSLFDALGTSNSDFLMKDNTEELGPTAVSSKRVPFTGLTQVDSFAKLGLETAFVIQAAQYVRFRLGGSLVHRTPHMLTNAVACNEDSKAVTGDRRAGSCVDRIWNPLYRPIIDMPGQRFRSAGEYTWTFFTSAVAQF